MTAPAKTDYETIAPRYDEERKHWHIHEDEVLTGLLAARTTGVTCLDLGCGTGNYLAAQARFFAGRSLRCFGLDSSEGMLRSARSKVAAGTLVRGRAERLPFADATFDFVFSGWALHHFEDKPAAVSEVSRVLTAAGCFKVRNIDPWAMQGWWLYRFFPRAWDADQRRFWPVATLVAALEAQGFYAGARVESRAMRLSAAEVLARAEMRVSSQLAILDDTDYREGVARLRRVVEADARAVIDSELATLTVVAWAHDPSALLATLYADDRREHEAPPPVSTPEYRALRDRDRSRRAHAARAVTALREHGTASANDLFHAAWLFHHGDRPEEARRAHELAREACERGEGRARWLAAAAFDRWCMYEGRPQKYGTQIVPDGRRYRLWDVDPSTTDVERAVWDVPALATQLARAEDMSRRLPQPAMTEAPTWLTDAIRRWRSAPLGG